MRDRARVLAATAAIGWIASLLAACEVAVSLDGLSGGAVAGDSAPMDSGGDGGKDTGGEGGRDAPFDSGGDSTAVSDALDSAPSDAGGGFCASQEAGYLLCSDFDLPGASVDQSFDLGFEYNGNAGNFQFDTTNFVSSPRSAQGIPNGFPGGGTAGIQLSGTLWSLEATPASVTCSLDWMPISLPTTAGVYSHILFLTVYADNDASSVLRGIGLNVLGDGTLQFLDDISANTAENTMNNFGAFSAPPQTWTHVVLSLMTSGGTTSYQALVGSVVGTGGLMVPLQATSRVTLGVGPAYYAGSTTTYTPSWIVDYDNVVCY